MNKLIGDKEFYYPNRGFLLNNSDDDDDLPEGSNGPMGINESSPEARRISPKSR